jgi:putative N6-adenine-specific DNA methylase
MKGVLTARGLTPRGLERRLKRHLLKEQQEYFAVCAVGFEEVLEQELSAISRQLSAENLTIQSKEPGGVTFVAPLEAMYHANLQLRTAHRVLLRIDDFLAQSYPMLFNKVRKIPWELYLGFNKMYSIQVSAKESRLHQHKTIGKTVHDGITEYLKPLELSPQLTDDAPLEIQARFFQDRCTLSLNTSGEHLHKRGYRQLVSEAPIRETLAASILQTIDVQSFNAIVDPMCGSGTFLIEAAMLLKNIAPGSQRSFAFEQLPFFQESRWERFKREAKAKQQKTSVKLLGSDIDAKNIGIAKTNAAKAGVADSITFEVAEARTLQISSVAKSLLICNVPYGERLEASVLTPFAKNLSKHFKGWEFAFVTKEMRWLKNLKVQNSQRFQNGGLTVHLVRGVV